MRPMIAYVRRNAFFHALAIGLALTLTTPLAHAGPPAPDKIDIGGGGLGHVNLTGPIAISVGGGPYESSQGGWAQRTIQNITNESVPVSEVEKFNSILDLGLTYGEGLGDDTFNSSLRPTYAKSASVVLELPIQWTNTGNQVTGPNYTCGGPVCVPGFESDGNVGVYTARVEVCLPDNVKTKLKKVMSLSPAPAHDLPCTTANGVQGNKGHWYDVADKPTTTYMTNLNSQSTATTDGTLSIPIKLPVPVNSLRVEIELGLKDLTSELTKDIADGSAYPKTDAPYIQSWWGTVNGHNSNGAATESPAGGPEVIATRFALQLPNITVLPAAIMQMKALPYTIVYRPPGDKSSGSYSTNESYGFALTTGESTAIDNTTSFMQSMNVASKTSVTALIADIEEDSTQSSSSTNASDINGTVGTGLTSTNSHSSARTWTLGQASADPTIFPASTYVTPAASCTPLNYLSTACTVNPAETYLQEPFWEDQIVLLLDPSAAMWNFDAGTNIQLLGGQQFDSISIRDLQACAVNSNQKAWKLDNGVYLTPAECRDLIVLDPYYVEGQAYDPSQTNRGVEVGNGNYGTDPRQPASASVGTAFQDIFTYTTAQSSNASASYQTSVTSMVGFSWSDGMTVSDKYSSYGLTAGFSTGTTLTQGYQQTTGNQLKVTYNDSTVATSTTTTTITGTFADDHDFYTPACQADSGACYEPQVSVYIDELFGGYMFSDPAAASNPGTTILHRVPYVPIKLPATVLNKVK